jgi:hypothetical protein
MDKWIPELYRPGRDEIQFAVDSREWQEFRLSLKGLPTEVKLDRLHHYLYTQGRSSGSQQEDDEADLKREIRVANYLAALRRGGLLNIHNEVVR